MPNWAFTDYVIEGPHETIAKIYEAMLHPIEPAPDTGLINDLKDEEPETWDDGWEGAVLKTLGIEWKSRQPDGSGLYMRGFIQEEPSIHENTLEFYAQEAWGATDFNEALEGAFPDIKVFYKVEEKGECIYATNDKEGKYFPERYWVDTAQDDIYQSEYFITEEAMWKWLSEKYGVKSKEDVEAFNSDYEDSGTEDENFIIIHEFEVID